MERKGTMKVMDKLTVIIIIIIIIINFIPRKSIHFVSFLVQWAIDKLKSFREKVYPEDRDPVHLGDGYPNEQYCTTVQKKV